MSLLEVKNLDISYGSIQVVKDVNFHVEQGEIICLIGANGAGKSSIIKSISGLVKPANGMILFNDEDISHLSADKIVTKGLIQCCEGRKIFQQMSVRENLEMGGYTINRKDIEPMIDSIYERFPRLKERDSQIAGTLSGGEQQMLAIGRALMAKPKLLMLDEPSMGLAPILVDEIFRIIKDLHESGTTILLNEQNAKMALKIANRGYVLETGKIILEGKGSDLLDNDKVKKAYLGG